MVRVPSNIEKRVRKDGRCRRQSISKPTVLRLTYENLWLANYLQKTGKLDLISHSTVHNYYTGGQTKTSGRTDDILLRKVKTMMRWST